MRGQSKYIITDAANRALARELPSRGLPPPRQWLYLSQLDVLIGGGGEKDTAIISFLSYCLLHRFAQQEQNPVDHIHGLGHVHMDTRVRLVPADSIEPCDAAPFWFRTRLEAFKKVIQVRPAMHDGILGCRDDLQPSIWDAPTREDESAAWALVQKGDKRPKKTPREEMTSMPLLPCTKDAGAGSKSEA